MYKTITYKRKSWVISGLTSDSRLVQMGMAFLAVRGTVVDGTDFIDDALKNGATTIITHTDMRDKLDFIPDTIQVIYSKSPRKVYAKMCNAFYQPHPKYTLAVTGTNGKTSVAHFAMQLLQRMGNRAIAVGTMGVHGDIQDTGACLTTPEPSTLHRILYNAHQQGIDYVCLEASSHGLDMHRLEGLSVQVGAFTNVTHDHLDYHGDMESYFNAKKRLFSHVLSPQNTAVLNASSPYFCRLQSVCLSRGIRVVSYGVVGKKMAVVPHIHVYAISVTDTGFDVHMSVMGACVCTHIPLIGTFQLENVLCALGMVVQTGATIGDVIPHLSALQPVCGRMHNVANTPSGAVIYVDYAHTPDALKTALQALRTHTQNRLLVVFGCGGNRDVEKRPAMGKIACTYADKVYVTDDNPRHEDPATIRHHILAGGDDTCTDAGNRITAISHAISDSQQGDIVLVAGKGHETGQVIGDMVYPYSDIQTIQDIVKDMSA